MGGGESRQRQTRCQDEQIGGSHGGRQISGKEWAKAGTKARKATGTRFYLPARGNSTLPRVKRQESDASS